MGNQQTTGVDPDLVKKILSVLEQAHAEVNKVQVDVPTTGMLGGSPHGDALLGDMMRATQHIRASLAQQAESLIKFGRALDEAMKAIQNADDDSAGYAKTIIAAVDGVTQQFHDQTGKDNRPQAPTAALGAIGLGGLGETLQNLVSEVQFTEGVEQ